MDKFITALGKYVWWTGTNSLGLNTFPLSREQDFETWGLGQERNGSWRRKEKKALVVCFSQGLGKLGRPKPGQSDLLSHQVQALEVESKVSVKSPKSEPGSNQAVGEKSWANQGCSRNCCKNSQSVPGYFLWTSAWLYFSRTCSRLWCFNI